MATRQPIGNAAVMKLTTQEIASLLPKIKKGADSIGVKCSLVCNGKQLEAQLLGHGAFGVVYRISFEQAHFAIKVFKVITKEEKLLYEKELENYRKIAQHNHSSIVQLYDSYAHSLDYFMTLEFAEASLYDALHGVVKGKTLIYTVGNVLVWSCQIADGVAFLHSKLFPDGPKGPKPMMHRDLKPDNILMFNACKQAKITDFGLARLDSTINKGGKSYAGTFRYMAPEVKKNEGEYDCKCDVYSTGAIIWEMINRKIFAPQSNNSNNDQTSPVLRAIYSTCLSEDPDMRPDMQRLLAYIQNVKNICNARTTHMIRNGPWTDTNEKSPMPPTEMETFNILWTQWELENAKKQLSINSLAVSHAAPLLNKIVVFGGHGPSDNVDSSVCSVSTAGEADWQDEPVKLPRSRLLGAAAVLTNPRRVLLVGGLEKWNDDPSKRVFPPVADVVAWDDAAAPSFSTVNNVPLLSRYDCDAVAVDLNTKVVITGGHDGKQELKSAELFLEPLKYCVRLPDMNEARSLLAMAADATRQPNQVIATGGYDNKKTVEWFDLAEMRWSAGPAMNMGRAGHAAASVSNFIYVAGRGKSVECLDCREARWQPTTDMIQERYLHRLLAVDDHRLFAIGNYFKSENSVEIFDERNRQWREATPMRTGRYSFQAVVL